MKLRIRGNSVRIRVSQSELDQMTAAGFTEDRVRFSPDAQLTYHLAVAPSGAIRADFSGTRLSVALPKAAFERWLEPGQVSVQGEQPIGGADTLKILIEKDFACLAPRAEEDESDLFPNPAEHPR